MVTVRNLDWCKTSDGLACQKVCIMPLRNLVLCAGQKQIFETFWESKISRTNSPKSGKMLQAFNRSPKQTTYLHTKHGGRKMPQVKQCFYAHNAFQLFVWRTHYRHPATPVWGEQIHLTLSWWYSQSKSSLKIFQSEKARQIILVMLVFQLKKVKGNTQTHKSIEATEFSTI